MLKGKRDCDRAMVEFYGKWMGWLGSEGEGVGHSERTLRTYRIRFQGVKNVILALSVGKLVARTS